MYGGLWEAGIKSLKSFGEWTAFLALVGLLLGLGYVCTKTIGNPLSGWGVNRFVLFAILFLASGTVTFQMQAKGLRIKETSPHGIVSFELAKTQDKADMIVEKWKSTTITPRKNVHIPANEQARKELCLDFLFIFFYVTLAGLICFWFAEQTVHPKLALLALTLGWSAPFAGILDVIENFALLRLLDNGKDAYLAPLAFWCALPKLFVTLVLIVPFILVIILVVEWRLLYPVGKPAIMK